MLYTKELLLPAIQAAFDHGGLECVCELMVKLLNEQEARHQAEMAQLAARFEARIAELEKRLGKNSSNSSKPPSSDGLKRRNRSLRDNQSGRKPGGQPGHPGQRLKPSSNPDEVIDVPLDQCPQCQEDLSAAPVVSVEERKELARTLVEMKQARDEALEKERSAVPGGRRRELEARYGKWLRQGLKKHPYIEKPSGQRGRGKQSTEHNLLRRLESKQSEVLGFLHDIELPFDNNLAERDLRMMKVQQKISGCFRSIAGAETFCVIRSYLSTARKQGLNLIQSIRDALAGTPSCIAQGAE